MFAPFTSGHRVVLAHDIMSALEKNGVGEASRKHMLAIAYSLKDEVTHL